MRQPIFDPFEYLRAENHIHRLNTELLHPWKLASGDFKKICNCVGSTIMRGCSHGF